MDYYDRKCDRCSSVWHYQDMATAYTDTEQLLCPKCIDELCDSGELQVCDDCNNFYSPDELSRTFNAWNICPSCLQEHWDECVECGEIYPRTHIVYDACEQPYCNYCGIPCDDDDYDILDDLDDDVEAYSND